MTLLVAVPLGFFEIPAAALRFWILFLLALRLDLFGTLQLATEGMLAAGRMYIFSDLGD